MVLLVLLLVLLLLAAVRTVASAVDVSAVCVRVAVDVAVNNF